MILINGDANTEMRKMIDDGVKVDAIITSPPYNMRTRITKGKYTTREKTDHFSKKYDLFGDALSINDYFEYHKESIQLMIELSDIVMWNISIVTGSKEAVFKLIGEFNRNIRDIIIWDKGNGQPAMHENIINRATELLIIFEKDGVGRTVAKSEFDRGTLNDIWRIKSGRKKVKGNSAIFPSELVDKFLDSFTKENDTVLDPFMGSGTTGISCLKNDRNFIGIELIENQFKIACTNMEKENLTWIEN